MRKLGTVFLLAMAVLWAAFATGCEASATGGTGATGGSANTTTGVGSGGTGGGQGGSGGDCVFDCTSGVGGNVQGQIVIAPANPIVTIENGALVTVPFTATLNGNDVTANVTWLFDRPEIGDINTSSTFIPTTLVGGLGKLSAKYSNAEGSTDVTVFIKKTVNSGNLPQGSLDLLDNPGGTNDPGMAVLYPYPKTVFPLGVLSPEIQWTAGNPNDGYKLKVTEKYYEYTEYFTQSPPGRHIIPQVDWDSIERSGSGSQSDPVTVALGRLSGGTAFKPELNTWHIAQGKLKGNIYYFELPDQCGSGRVVRIKPDAEQVDAFYTTGGCFGCHSVSRDGKTMMATVEQGSPFPQITIDLSVEPAMAGSLKVGQTPIGGTFSAFNEKGDKILVSNDGDFNGAERLRIVDSTTGAVLNENAMGNNCGEPAWSPTGKKIAGICNITDNFGWIFDAKQGDLTIADVADDGTTVSNITTLVPKGNSNRPTYPSFSPGGDYIAYGRASDGSRTTGQGDLWLVDVNNGANLKKLAIASSDNKSFNPVFAPLRAGGFYWLVYVTRRDYGNRLVGANRQQLWITAIDDPPTSADPSHPPFYVRGQEDCAKSENAYMALPPCKDKGESCLEGSDCCNGQCIKDGQTGMYVCGDPPPPGMCSQDGNSCMSDADCCNFDMADPSGSSQCIDGFCTPPVPE